MAKNIQNTPTSIESLEASVKVINDLINKLNEFSKDPANPNITMMINSTASLISYHAKDVMDVSRKIATIASVKEQHDHAVDNAAQMNEDFTAMLQKRKPNRIQKNKVK